MLVLASVVALAQPAGAGTQTNPNSTYCRPGSDEYKPERLTQIVDLPNVPRYTGRAVFLSGLRYPRDTSGERIGMSLAVMESEPEILDWYKQALKMYSWRIMENGPNERCVSAMQGNNTFTVRISPSRVPGYRTLIVLSFKFGK